MTLEELLAIADRVDAQIAPIEAFALEQIESAIRVARSKRLQAGDVFDPYHQGVPITERPDGDAIALEHLLTKEAKDAWFRAAELKELAYRIKTTIQWKEDGCP